MSSQVDTATVNLIDNALRTFGYSTTHARGRFALIALGRDRIILLYSQLAKRDETVRDINGSLDEIFFDKKFGAHTFEMYVLIVCDENMSDAGRYAIEADISICRKLTISKNELRSEQISTQLMPLQALDLTSLLPRANERIEEVFADILRQNAPEDLAAVLSQAFREGWSSEGILDALKGMPS